MKRAIRALAWAWTLLMAVLVIGALTTSALGAASMFALACLASCPAMWDGVAEGGVSVPRFLKVGVPLGLFVAGVGLLPATEESRPAEPVPTPQIAAVSVEPTPSIAEQIASLAAEEAKLPKDRLDDRVSLLQRLVALSDEDSPYQAKLDKALAEQALADKIRERPEECFELVRYKGTKGGFGNVLLMDLTIRNYGLSHLKDFVVHCEHSGPSGTVMDSNTLTLYQMVEAGQTRRFREINMGLMNPQATRTNCRIDSASIG